MNGIEKITGQIEADVQREIDDLTAQAQAQAAEILADYEARARACLLYTSPSPRDTR